MIERIQTADAPVPAGHYSQAIKANGFIFVSGQLPFAPGPHRVMPQGIAAQARQCLENLRAILQAAGTSVDSLTSVQIFISDVALWGEVNAVYESFMGQAQPARTVVPTNALHHGALIELNAVAVCP
ncbi:RidA family protein [Bordetella genomosp. 9]|uniref:RidA family protein n=1 Tax=Bordetella genomosp. 9 TaxID=1416803 RepID=UPI000A32535C|nr:Rid family detoxifying hydrolase [Bordetella genomosp. 9]